MVEAIEGSVNILLFDFAEVCSFRRFMQVRCPGGPLKLTDPPLTIAQSPSGTSACGPMDNRDLNLH